MRTQDWKYTLIQMNLTNIYRTFHPTTVAQTFLSHVHRTFSKIDWSYVKLQKKT